MKGDPEERAVQIGRYLVQSGATVRAAAQVFGVSKSTVWKDQCRLQHLAPGLWQEVRAVLLYNKAQRHLRGGEATRCKYLHAQHNQKNSIVKCNNFLLIFLYILSHHNKAVNIHSFVGSLL